MSRVLFLTQRMSMGYGVALEVHEVSRRLGQRGHEVAVLCSDVDDTYQGPYQIVRLAHVSAEEVQAFASSFGPTAIVAFTSPFFEMLPDLSQRYVCWAWENGDPTPALFGAGGHERERIKRYKIEFCYPAVHGVLAISEFIRSDMEWPKAFVVYLGCDHVPDRGTKGLEEVRLSRRDPLRIGTLMRLGSGETKYKGNRLFLTLVEMARTSGDRMEFSVMGRGSKRSARMFSRSGVNVFLDADDEEKWQFLRSLDVFVSCSLWEGFNLPLVEAQAMGTVGLAFDTGAHPEVTPMVFPGVPAMYRFLVRCGEDRTLLLRHSKAAYQFVRRSFSWDETTKRFEGLVLANGGRIGRSVLAHARGVGPVTGRVLPRPEWRSVSDGLARGLVATARSARLYGWRVTVRKIRRKVTDGLRRALSGRG